MARPIKLLRSPHVRELGVGGRTRNFIDVQVNPRQIAAIEKRMDRLRGKPMAVRVEKAMWIEGDTMAKKMKQAAPRGPTGHLRKSINARKQRKGALESAFGGRSLGNILVGPRANIAPHRHLVLRGTGNRPVTSRRSSNPWRAWGGRAYRTGSLRHTGAMTANPFVDRAIRGSRRNVKRAVEKAWLERL